MRKARFVLGTIVFVGLVGMDPARADYPWCIQNSEFGYPGDCAYQTHQECLASLSGRKGDCGVNPSVLFGPPRQQRGPQCGGACRSSIQKSTGRHRPI
jgi:hypothetical protein